MTLSAGETAIPHERIGLSNRQYLRAMTSAAHDKAEARWFSRGQFASRESYQHWLRSMHRVHSTLGAHAVQHEHLTPYSAMEYERAQALSVDLDIPEKPAFAVTLEQPSSAWPWGVLYALNGSSIGASTLLKSGQIMAEWPNQYLQVMTRFATSGALGTFFAELDSRELNLSDCVSGATAVFSALAADE